MNQEPTDNVSVPESDYGIVLFDGHCNLCNRSVDFIIRNDSRARLKFASLQSDAGLRELRAHGVTIPPEGYRSIVFIERGRVYTFSEAVIRIAMRLDGLWPVFGVFLLIPGALRDLIYRTIAGNRYRWFGKSAVCRMPTPELSRRFLV